LLLSWRTLLGAWERLGAASQGSRRAPNGGMR
jgi:hypothetical protein